MMSLSERYFFLNFGVFFSRIDSIRLFINRSPEQKITLFSLFSFRMLWAIAWARCVFPTPTPPYKKSGLYEVPGFCATACEAAKATWLVVDTAKLSKL